LFHLAETKGPAVSLVAEPIFHIGPFAISNSNLLGFLGSIIFIYIFYSAAKLIRNGTYNRFSVAILWLYEISLKTIEDAMGGNKEQARRLAPLPITLFLFVLLNNWLGILPFVGPLTYNGLPLFRGLAADLNFTAALAVITMVTTQIWAIQTYGFRGNIGRYIANPLKSPMHAFEGFLELLSEFSRLIALAMRLFGNVFGGEVLLAVMGYITSYASPLVLPVFMLFELFVGAVQAYVFFMLTVVFVALVSKKQDAHGAEAEHTIAADTVAA
jgi:F-type H+-transporting ATPase subunit a